MAVTFQPRTGTPQWSLGTDPLTRDQLDAAFAALEQRAALYAQGNFVDRPAVGVQGRMFWAMDTGVLYYDDGAAWHVAGAGAGGGSSRVSQFLLMGA